MSVTTTIEVIPGAAAVSGAPTVAISDLTRLASPVGDAATLLARYTGTLNVIQRNVIGMAYLQLRNAGVLAKLDALAIRGPNLTDSLMNWVNAARPAINNGATWAAGAGFATDGVSQWLNLNFASGGHFSLNSACAGAYVSGTPTFAANAPLLSHGPSGSSAFRVYPQTGTAGQALVRINSSASSSTGNRVRADCGGFWHAQRASGNQALWQDSSKLIDATVAPNIITPGLAIGQVGGTFGAVSGVSAWWYGEPLTDAQRIALRAGIETILQVI